MGEERVTQMEKANLPPAARELIQRFENRQARVGILGLGYVGLPLAVALAKAGLHVTGIDLDTAKVDSLSRGESYIEDVPSADIAALVRAGTLRATTDFGALGGHGRREHLRADAAAQDRRS